MVRRRKAGRSRLDHPAVVIVEWHDSRTLSSRWIDREKVLNEAPADFADCPISAGFLLEATDDYIVLALSFVGGIDDVAEVVQIPKAEIRWMKEVEPRRGGKWKKS